LEKKIFENENGSFLSANLFIRAGFPSNTSPQIFHEDVMEIIVIYSHLLTLYFQRSSFSNERIGTA
jgi:hypothetical protein